MKELYYTLGAEFKHKDYGSSVFKVVRSGLFAHCNFCEFNNSTCKEMQCSALNREDEECVIFILYDEEDTNEEDVNETKA